MEVVRCSETSENSSTARRRKPKEDHQLDNNCRVRMETYHKTSYEVAKIMMMHKYNIETRLSPRIIKKGVQITLVSNIARDFKASRLLSEINLRDTR
jgi:hypothetical protein